MVQTRPIHAKPKGPLQGEAKRGFDAAYGEQDDAARRELDGTMLGRDKPYGVARDDTEMKNPDGDLQAPSANPVKKR